MYYDSIPLVLCGLGVLMLLVVALITLFNRPQDTTIACQPYKRTLNFEQINDG